MEAKEQETKELMPQELEVQKPEVQNLISLTLAEKARVEGLQIVIMGGNVDIWMANGVGHNCFHFISELYKTKGGGSEDYLLSPLFNFYSMQ